eukprot:CAMPEP_0201494522 /NCGR_PEP_ID=MMETSP0151_2-20130828/48017_1 /ASSEMBLY_ACC=CAM_ASM_000257 /TAXON_ID=200890 /ORGANISM="Paramoeba atlantica, Strain 621/1 / CCAP 1560/9" /LENGTH=151 /DNA_ID=CAMNT_0047882823 /DNA_START=358 /DNA_END=810 /DNA_ORIENTATION=+
MTHSSIQEMYTAYADQTQASCGRVGFRHSLPGAETDVEDFSGGTLYTEREVKDESEFGDILATLEHNQRLEFLGDSVLTFIVATALFRMFPDESEGTMSSLRTGLVNNKLLSFLARRSSAELYYLHAPHPSLTNATPQRMLMYADLMEALL